MDKPSSIQTSSNLQSSMREMMSDDERRRSNDDITKILKNTKSDQMEQYRGSLVAQRKANEELADRISDLEDSINYGHKLNTRLSEESWDNVYKMRLTSMSPEVMEDIVDKLRATTLNVRIRSAVTDVVIPFGRLMEAISEDNTSVIKEQHIDNMKESKRLADIIADGMASSSGQNSGAILAVKNFVRSPFLNQVSMTLAAMTSLTKRVLIGKGSTMDEEILEAIRDQTEYLRTGTILSKEGGFFSSLWNKGVLGTVGNIVKSSVLAQGGITKKNAQKAEDKRSLGMTPGIVEKMSEFFFKKNIDLKGRGLSTNSEYSPATMNVTLSKGAVINIYHDGKVNSNWNVNNTTNSANDEIQDNRRKAVAMDVRFTADNLNDFTEAWAKQYAEVNSKNSGVYSNSPSFSYEQSKSDNFRETLLLKLDEQSDKTHYGNKKLKDILGENKKTNRTLTLQLLKSLIVPLAIAAAVGSLSTFLGLSLKNTALSIVGALGGYKALKMLGNGSPKAGISKVADAVKPKVKNGLETAKTGAEKLRNGVRSTAKFGKSLLKAGGRVGLAAVAYGAYDAYSNWKDGTEEMNSAVTPQRRDQLRKKRNEAVGGSVGGSVGGLAGSVAMATTLGSLGFMIGGPVGGAIGGILGSVVGAVGGTEVGKRVGAGVVRVMEDFKTQTKRVFDGIITWINDPVNTTIDSFKKLGSDILNLLNPAREETHRLAEAERERSRSAYRNLSHREKQNLYSPVRYNGEFQDRVKAYGLQRSIPSRLDGFSANIMSRQNQILNTNSVTNSIEEAVRSVLPDRLKDNEPNHNEEIRDLLKSLLDETRTKNKKDDEKKKNNQQYFQNDPLAAFAFDQQNLGGF